MSLSQTIGVLLGSGWDGKDGSPVPPLAGLNFPSFDDIADDASFAELAHALQDLDGEEPATDDAVTEDRTVTAETSSEKVTEKVVATKEVALPAKESTPTDTAKEELSTSTKEEAPEKKSQAESLKTGETPDPDQGVSAGAAEDNTPTKNRHRLKRFNGPTSPAPVSATEAETSARNSDTTSKKRWTKRTRGSKNSE